MAICCDCVVFLCVVFQIKSNIISLGTLGNHAFSQQHLTYGIICHHIFLNCTHKVFLNPKLHWVFFFFSYLQYYGVHELFCQWALIYFFLVLLVYFFLLFLCNFLLWHFYCLAPPNRLVLERMQYKFNKLLNCHYCFSQPVSEIIDVVTTSPSTPVSWFYNFYFNLS